MSKEVLITERLRMDMDDFWDKVENRGFEYQDEDLNIAEEISKLHPNIHFGGKCASHEGYGGTKCDLIIIEDLES